MTPTMLFHFPMPPNLANVKARGSSDWKSRHFGKRKYLAHLDDLQRYGVLPPPPKEAFASCIVSSVMHLGHQMDDDNALARHKWPIDWLKTRGYIVEDRKRNLRWLALPEQVVARKQAYEIELTITPSETK